MKNSARFPQIATEERLRKLVIPEDGKIPMVLDTDTYNEIDDQFALAFAASSPERIELRAVTAAPFFNARSTGPGDGMEKSYNEILNILKLLKHPAENFAFRGSLTYLPDADTPVDSPAARRIIELAQEAGRKGETLYVCGIAAITNIASAILLEPEIIRHIVVVWLGGHPEFLPYNREFNLFQDVAAAQVVLDSGVPFIRVPCLGVAELLSTNMEMLKEGLAHAGEVGQFLYRRAGEFCDEFQNGDRNALKVIWDISVPALFVIPKMFMTEVVPTPILNDDLSWTVDPGRHPMRVVRYMWHRNVFQALFQALSPEQAKADNDKICALW